MPALAIMLQAPTLLHSEFALDACADLGVDDMIMNSIGQAGWNPGLLDSNLPGEHSWKLQSPQVEQHVAGIHAGLLCPSLSQCGLP